jgi:alpha-amylase/alpha-mannosidase (GH57 family)
MNRVTNRSHHGEVTLTPYDAPVTPELPTTAMSARNVE